MKIFAAQEETKDPAQCTRTLMTALFTENPGKSEKLQMKI